jgi:arachidonate 15-lipoxygenase
MWNRLLFAIYRHTFGLFIYLGFRSQKVRPLEPPIDEQITLVPFGSRKPVADIPRLYDMQSFPKADHARSRRRRIDVTRPLVGALGHLKRPGLPPVPQDHDEMIQAIYPYFFRQSWPEPPTVPPELAETHDPLAAVAVAGPVADYLKRISHDEIDRINDIAPGHVDAGAYTIGLEALARHPVKPGLEPIGCTVVFETDDDTGELRTRSIVYRNEVVTPSTERWHTAERVALCSLTTHLSVIKHNVYVHLMYLTVSTAVTVNTLGADHPIRRLVHHCFQTALIGNYEVAQFQIRGEDAFCCTLFSYDYETMIAVINDHLDTFDLGLLDPVESAQNRGVVDVDFAYPYHANVMPLWDIIWGPSSACVPR